MWLGPSGLIISRFIMLTFIILMKIKSKLCSHFASAAPRWQKRYCMINFSELGVAALLLIPLQEQPHE